jgi:hypothetical protein
MMARALLPILTGALLLAAACRPDPYALFLRALSPGEPIDLPGERTLTVDGIDGRTLSGVHLEGPAETCDGTMVLDAPRARIEPVATDAGGAGGAGRRVRIVLEQPKAVERCGPFESVTTHERLTVTVDLGG